MKINRTLLIDNNFFPTNSIDITVGSDYTVPSDGVVTYGGYGTSIMLLTVNGTVIGQCYGGNQSNGSLYNSWRVYKGDIVKIDRIRGSASEGNVHLFRNYS